MRRVHGPLIVLGLLGLACSAVDVRQQSADRYEKVRTRWTRAAKSLERFDLQVSIAATFLSNEYCIARREHLTALYQYGPEEVARLEADGQKDQARGEEFLVGIFVPDRKHDKLHRRHSPWHLRLLVDELPPLTPVEIQRDRRPLPEREVLYPHFEIWDRVYRVFFPRERSDGSPAVPPGSRFVRLALDGPLGVARLEWDLQKLGSK